MAVNRSVGDDAKLPWYAHPNDKGRNIQAKQVADKVEQILNR